MQLSRLMFPNSVGRKELIRTLERLTERDWDLTIEFGGDTHNQDLHRALNRFMRSLEQEISHSTRTAIAMSAAAPRLSELATGNWQPDAE
ncbi:MULTISPECIES: hypothetical protein [Marinobacter]|uniref:hypothetical protein n=1 Tax=Marinobacter TaxID=2742 RepID=UPI0012459E84|nr:MULTISPECIES: hypothetical protein [Marinobacter]MBL3559059.1 hypothetical protein [Marinobacter sp. JB05H06]